MGIEEAVGKFSWKIFGGKVVKKAVTGIVSYLVAKAAAVGVEVDPAQLTALLFVAIEAGKNLLKHKFPKQMGWL